MKWLLLSLLMLGPVLSAQMIDKSRSRFLTSPNGRTGSYAPFRLALAGLDGMDTATVRSVSPGVVLEKQIAVAGRTAVEVIIPVLVGEGSHVEFGEDQFTPPLPTRRVEPDYERPYVAVFSTDPLYARGVLPNVPGTCVCDYYDLGDFFTDWRLLDGYDAVVIFNPLEARLPPGSQRAIAEFCSLGGTALVVGSFRMGEMAVDLPAPAELQLRPFRDVQARRFGYGPGAIYQFGANDLRHSRSAQLVLIDAMLDQAWYGAAKAPANKPDSRLPPARTPFAPPLPPADATPGALFWGLASGLLLLCALLPGVAGRYVKRVWPVQLAVAAACAGVGGVALLQDRPLPTVEAQVLIRRGEGEAASARVFLIGQEPWRYALTINLDDANDRGLPRRLPARPGWNAWLIDLPLVHAPAARADGVRLAYGMVGEDSFRDFSTKAHRAQTKFSMNEAFLVEWWLDANAWRGRRALVTPVEWPGDVVRFDDARVVPRGAISVTPVREQG